MSTEEKGIPVKHFEFIDGDLHVECQDGKKFILKNAYVTKKFTEYDSDIMTVEYVDMSYDKVTSV